MSHPSNNNRVMVSEVVNTTEEIVVDKVITSRVLATRPSPSNSPSLRLDPLNLLLLPPAPTLNTFQFRHGHIVSPISFPPLPPTSFYLSFNKALSLAQRIGVQPTTQTLKRPSDPHPLKKYSPPKEDEDNIDMFMEESVVAGPSGTTQRYVHSKRANGHSDISAVTRTCYESLFNILVTNISFVYCPLHVNEDQSEACWVLNSRASCHFTNDINDFVEYEENVGTEQVVRTANGSTSIAGKGTVIFTVNSECIRLSPIYYIPDLNNRLLSLRTLLPQMCAGKDDSKAFSPFRNMGNRTI